MMMQQKMITTPMLPWTSFASASVFNSKQRADFPQVLLTVGTDLLDITDIYKKTVHCEVLTLPIPILPIPDLELITREPIGSMLHNIHWEKIKEKEDQISIKITGNVSNWWNGGGLVSVHSSVVAPSPQGLASAFLPAIRDQMMPRKKNTMPAAMVV